ncbi:transketolase 1, partial [Klebsiella pneumoniae]
GGHRQTVPADVQNHHRFRFAEQSRYPRLPRRAAGRRRNRPDPRSAGLETRAV